MSETIFTMNSRNHQLCVEREFAADCTLVWQAWTDCAILDEWWARQPWKAETKSMDFRQGGNWLYCMQGPEGEKNWCRVDFLKIVKGKGYDCQDSFCDEEGNKNNSGPSMHWKNTFTAMDNSTKVNSVISFASLDNLNTIIRMGFKEGFSGGHENLEAWLKRQGK